LEAVGLNAPDGEREKWVTPVKLEGPVEAGFGGQGQVGVPWGTPQKMVVEC